MKGECRDEGGIGGGEGRENEEEGPRARKKAWEYQDQGAGGGGGREGRGRRARTKEKDKGEERSAGTEVHKLVSTAGATRLPESSGRKSCSHLHFHVTLKPGCSPFGCGWNCSTCLLTTKAVCNEFTRAAQRICGRRVY